MLINMDFASSILLPRLQNHGANFVVATRKVDGENWEVIEEWMGKVTDWVNSQHGLTAAGQSRLDYLDLAAIEESEEGTYNRNNPFWATLKVSTCIETNTFCRMCSN